MFGFAFTKEMLSSQSVRDKLSRFGRVMSNFMSTSELFCLFVGLDFCWVRLFQTSTRQKARLGTFWGVDVRECGGEREERLRSKMDENGPIIDKGFWR